MKRLLIKKLVVINDGEKKSKELNFEEGLNIIIGKNKTGKSSLIKSIFHCLGCEVKMEPSWKSIIDWYLLQFNYGDQTYEILRRGKEFKVIEITEQSYRLLIDTDSFHDFCDYLTIEIFKIDFPLITKDLKEINVTTPILFRFQYIDQDNGWSKIAESFTNMKYVPNWKEFSNKYIIGYQGEDFYKLKKQNSLSNEMIRNFRLKLKHYEELLEHINSSISSSEKPMNIDENLNTHKSLLQELDELTREEILLQEKLSKAQNEQYEKRLSLKMLQATIKDLESDHEFALNEKEEITCPFCGTNHTNSLLERTEIIKDIQTGNKLVGDFRKELKMIQLEISSLKNNLSVVNRKLKRNKSALEHNIDGQSIASTYRNEGKREFFEISSAEKRGVVREIEIELEKVEKNNEKLNEFVSRKRANAIRADFNDVYKGILEELNIPISFLKLRDFVQVLDNTGSELPRIIYAYHIALYLYNLEKERGIFNWLVVDTPNQQGQDDKNLLYIDSVMNKLLSNKGQFILGTERATGFEDLAANLIQLDGYKQTLDSTRYKEHRKHLEEILNIEKLGLK